MKKTIMLLAGILLFMNLFSQDEFMKPLKMEIGYVLHLNTLNEDHYFDYLNRNYLVNNAVIHGVNLKFSTSFRKNMDLIFGAIFEVGADQYGSTNWSPGVTNSDDYVLNGGGVYVGLNPHTGGEHFGLDADIAAGIMAYKEYRVIFNNLVVPYVDRYDKKSSIFGGIATLGFYLKGKTFGISPELQFLMAGGSNGSFLFFGFGVPLTITF